MDFLADKKSLFYISVIFLLAATLIATSLVLAKNGSDISASYDAVSSELEEAKKSLEAAQQEKDSVSAQLEAERKEKERLKQENDGLRQKIEELSAQKFVDAEMKKQAIMSVTKVCYLTFDDGPCENTLAILDILARYSVKATFFVKGSSKNIEYLKNIQAAGHAIGLHTFSHVYSSIYSSDNAYYTDLQQVSDIVAQYTGIRTPLIRFPGGSSNGISKNYSRGIMSRIAYGVQSAGYTYFDWNVDSLDAEGKSAPQILDAVLTQASRKNGGICVLMHDIKSSTTEALPAIIEGLSAQGFYFDVLTPQTYGFHHSIHN